MAAVSSDPMITDVADDATHACYDVATQDNGGDEGTRTPDPRDANAVLSQLSYIPTADRVARRHAAGPMGPGV